MLKLFLQMLLLHFSFQTMAQNKVCVLTLFAEYSKEDQLIQKSFYNKKGELLSPQLEVYHQASLDEIKNCFSDPQYHEVVFVAHGMSKKISGGLSNYGFPIFYDRVNQKKSLLYPRFFQNLSILAQSNHNLKKVRIAVCGINFEETNAIYSSIDLLIQSLKQQGIFVDISPKSIFFSYLLNDDVTRVRKSWLRKSIPLSMPVTNFLEHQN